MGVGIGPRVGFNGDMEREAVGPTGTVGYRDRYVGFSAGTRRRGEGEHAVAIVDEYADRVDDYVGKRLGVGIDLDGFDRAAYVVSGRLNPEHGVVEVQISSLAPGNEEL